MNMEKVVKAVAQGIELQEKSETGPWAELAPKDEELRRRHSAVRYTASRFLKYAFSLLGPKEKNPAARIQAYRMMDTLIEHLLQNMDVETVSRVSDLNHFQTLVPVKDLPDE